MKQKNSIKGLLILVLVLLAAALVLSFMAYKTYRQRQQAEESSESASSMTSVPAEGSGQSDQSSQQQTDDSSSSDLSQASDSSASSNLSEPESSPESSLWETSDTESESSKQEEAEVDDAVVTAKAQKILDSMSLEEKVGQMFYGRFPGPGQAEQDAETYHLGGYVLFAVDFEGYTQEEVVSHIDACQEVSSIPMLMGVDEEGGTVTRVSDYFRDTPFLSPRDEYVQGGWDLVESETKERADLLKKLHLNMNLAPVCDMADDPDDFMYDRSFGSDVDLTSTFVSQSVRWYNQKQMGCCLKHFPGYGSNLDTHTGMSVDTRDKETFLNHELIPFQAGIDAGAPAIMVCHNIINCFDDVNPASLSPAVHELLRDQMGYQGVIITDDLAMGAITDFCGEVNSAVKAIEAGNDLLISTEYADQYAAVMEAIQAGQISEDRIDQSVLRILKMKIRLGILANK